MTHRSGSAVNKLEISKIKAQGEKGNNFMNRVLRDARSRGRILRTHRSSKPTKTMSGSKPKSTASTIEVIRKTIKVKDD